MNEQDIAAVTISALGRAADQAAGDATALVSVTLEILDSAPVGAVQPHVTRKTRTLLFMAADVTSREGRRIAVANSVHKVRA
ncbi:MAG: hypothetical protein QM759_07230 [Terricaulis sp.]